MTSKKELLKALDKINGSTILVAGDLILDRYVWGGVDRISPEAPVPVVNVARIEDRIGGAGNVVSNLVNLGVKVRVSGFLGEDSEGTVLSKLFDSQGVDQSGVIKLADRPTSLKTRVIAQRQQIVRIDREEATPPANDFCLRLGSLITEQIKDVNAVIISDYGKGSISNPVLAELTRSCEAGLLSFKDCPLILDPHPVNYGRYKGFHVVKPNRKEAEAASGVQITDTESAIKAATEIKKRWQSELVIITLGEDGILLSPSDSEPMILPTQALEVFDVSGAGDTVTAVFTAALATGSGYTVAGHLANLAAGVVVAEVGTVPITLSGLKDHISKIDKLRN